MLTKSAETIIHTYIDDDFSIWYYGDKELTPDIANSLLQPLQTRFCDEFIDFLCSPLNGMKIEAREQVWPRPEIYADGPKWSFQYGLSVCGIGDRVPAWMHLIEATEQFRNGTGLFAVPFMSILGDQDEYCFVESGEIVKYDKDTGTLLAVNNSFNSILEKELKELQERKERIKRSSPY